MGEWKLDGEVMDALASLVIETREPMNRFLNSIGNYNDGTPLFAFLQIFGVFINGMGNHLEEQTETDAFDLTVAEIVNHPTVQGMVASMMQKQIDRGLNLE